MPPSLKEIIRSTAEELAVRVRIDALPESEISAAALHLAKNAKLQALAGDRAGAAENFELAREKCRTRVDMILVGAEQALAHFDPMKTFLRAFRWQESEERDKDDRRLALSYLHLYQMGAGLYRAAIDLAQEAERASDPEPAIRTHDQRMRVTDDLLKSRRGDVRKRFPGFLEHAMGRYLLTLGLTYPEDSDRWKDLLFNLRKQGFLTTPQMDQYRFILARRLLVHVRELLALKDYRIAVWVEGREIGEDQFAPLAPLEPFLRKHLPEALNKGVYINDQFVPGPLIPEYVILPGDAYRLQAAPSRQRPELTRNLQALFYTTSVTTQSTAREGVVKLIEPLVPPFRWSEVLSPPNARVWGKNGSIAVEARTNGSWGAFLVDREGDIAFRVKWVESKGILMLEFPRKAGAADAGEVEGVFRLVFEPSAMRLIRQALGQDGRAPLRARAEGFVWEILGRGEKSPMETSSMPAPISPPSLGLFLPRDPLVRFEFVDLRQPRKPGPRTAIRGRVLARLPLKLDQDVSVELPPQPAPAPAPAPQKKPTPRRRLGAAA